MILPVFYRKSHRVLVLFHAYRLQQIRDTDNEEPFSIVTVIAGD